MVADATAEQLESLFKLTERYRVVYETLRDPPPITVRRRYPTLPGQIPMRVLLVGDTMISLWILAEPNVARPFVVEHDERLTALAMPVSAILHRGPWLRARNPSASPTGSCHNALYRRPLHRQRRH